MGAMIEKIHKRGEEMELYHQFVGKTLLQKGFSGDRKYCAVLPDGRKYLLRISPADQYARKLHQFHAMEHAASLGIPMCMPVEFGSCDDGVYAVHTWIDGVDAEDVMAAYSDSDQYRYGLDAGRWLRMIHTIPAPDDTPDWERFFNAKVDRKIAMYRDCELKYDGGELFLDYLERNRHLLHGRPVSYQHGDYHIGNMMIDGQGKLFIIDFDRDDYGDPWEEFNRIVWSARNTPYFAAGIVDGYFGGDVPMTFWQLLAFYLSSNAIGSLPWAIPYGEEEVQIMHDLAAQTLQWYDNMKTVIPAWYRRP